MCCVCVYLLINHINYDLFLQFLLFFHLKTELWLILSQQFYLPSVDLCQLLLSTCGFTEGVQYLGDTFCPYDAVFPSPHCCCLCPSCGSCPLLWLLVLVTFLIACQIADEKPLQNGSSHLSSVPYGGGDADANNLSDLSGNQRFS